MLTDLFCIFDDRFSTDKVEFRVTSDGVTISYSGGSINVGIDDFNKLIELLEIFKK